MVSVWAEGAAGARTNGGWVEVAVTLHTSRLCAKLPERSLITAVQGDRWGDRSNNKTIWQRCICLHPSRLVHTVSMADEQFMCDWQPTGEASNTLWHGRTGPLSYSMFWLGNHWEMPAVWFKSWDPAEAAGQRRRGEGRDKVERRNGEDMLLWHFIWLLQLLHFSFR